ncbi:glycosyltransferase family 4 protein [Mycoplasmoides alvi]|uniref:glycosyltransferase family 4 protein n=1 Tax=Mycoplasmoides alvi TaxID=78580 RepID=UPI00051AE6A6|nr:glycosyltransferase family 4 protein [Mycoplasmoides alvi]
MKKKVLIINNQQHNYAGGVEKYSRNLITILHSLDYEIYEYATLENIQNKVCEPIQYVKQINFKYKNKFQELNLKQFNNNLFTFLLHATDEIKVIKKQREHLKEIAKNFDLIICNTNFVGGLNDKDHSKLIWVQHFDFATLKHLVLIPRLILKLFTKMTFPYKEIKQKVVFSRRSKDLYKKLFFNLYKKSKFYEIPLTMSNDLIKLPQNINNKIYKPIAFMGRLQDEHHKKIKLANKVAKHLGTKINAYGTYSDNFLKKYPYINFLGSYKPTDLEKILNDSSLVLMTSKYEGMPYVGIEAINYSTPIIVRNSYAEAKTLVMHNNGILLNKFMKPKTIAKEIKNLLNDKNRYTEMVHNTLKFQNELSHQVFVDKWKETIEAVMKENI